MTGAGGIGKQKAPVKEKCTSSLNVTLANYRGGELAWPNDEREGRAKSALIRRCGATFSLRAKSRLRRLRSDTRLRAQPLGGSL